MWIVVKNQASPNPWQNRLRIWICLVCFACYLNATARKIPWKRWSYGCKIYNNASAPQNLKDLMVAMVNYGDAAEVLLKNK